MGRQSNYGVGVMWRSTSWACENLREKSSDRHITGYATQDLLCGRPHKMSMTTKARSFK